MYTGLFYYILGNLRPELRSTHRAIQLIACIESPVLEKYGFDKVLAPFIKDVKTLYNVSIIISQIYLIMIQHLAFIKDGIEVIADGRFHKFRGAVLLMLWQLISWEVSKLE